MVPDFVGQDLSGSRFERLDLNGAQFRSVDLSRAQFRGVEPADVQIDGMVQNVVIKWSFIETLRHLVARAAT